MRLPILNHIPETTEMINVFKGYNHNLQIGDGEFFNTKNLTTDSYPVFSPRVRRGTYNLGNPSFPGAVIAKDNLCYVDGAYIVINGNRINMSLTDGDKTLVSFGAYILIFPDKKYINTSYTNDHGSINVDTSLYGASAVLTPCKADGTAITGIIVSATEPTEFQDGSYWLDTVNNLLKQYSVLENIWLTINSYVKIANSYAGQYFYQGDCVYITNLAGTSGSGDNAYMFDLNGYRIVEDRQTDYVIINGLISETTTFTYTAATRPRLQRTIPDMDFMIESGNRLWGCKYGIVNGQYVNEIYASKLGDFRNFNVFQGISTDSYAASVGTDGAWTGAITHLGYPIFFKENHLHKVYGNYPGNYQIQETACKGVQKDSGRSMAIVNGILYYKSATGICQYDGSLPIEVSEALGDENYTEAVGCAYGNKYYVSMKGENNKYNLFVYDTRKRIWMKEDETKTTDFAVARNILYYIESKTANGTETRKIRTVGGDEDTTLPAVQWEAETGIIGMNRAKNKILKRIMLRAALDVGARFSVLIQYDSSGEYESVYNATSTTLRTFDVSVIPKRCDHFRLKFIGRGNCRIFTLTKIISEVL